MYFFFTLFAPYYCSRIIYLFVWCLEGIDLFTSNYLHRSFIWKLERVQICNPTEIQFLQLLLLLRSFHEICIYCFFLGVLKLLSTFPNYKYFKAICSLGNGLAMKWHFSRPKVSSSGFTNR